MTKVLYIGILDTVPSQMVPVLVAHSVMNADTAYQDRERYAEAVDRYLDWKLNSFRKCTLSVNEKEFGRLCQLHPGVFTGYENTVLGGAPSCVIPLPYNREDRPNVLRYARLWEPQQS